MVKIPCGDFAVFYVLDPVNHLVGLRLLPLAKSDAAVPHRVHLETPEILALPQAHLPVRAYHGETSLVQLKLAEDDSGAGFGGGRSMRVNPTVESLRFKKQIIHQRDTGIEIHTELTGGRHFLCTHILNYQHGEDAVTVRTEFENLGNETLTLEMLSSFSFGYLSPFDGEDSAERLRVHRFRSSWSSEGRHEERALEDLHLERSWTSTSVVSERFGQVGSMPVRSFFPFIAIEDYVEKVFWGAQLACPSSWQMEIFRRDDKVSVSGGLADREFGHWMKQVYPGKKFISPPATLSTSTGNLDDFCQRLVRSQIAALAGVPEVEHELPVAFNEWCSTWGWPTPDFIAQTAERLRDTPVRIFVIDDGWADKPPGAGQFNGDWNVEARRFPQGLKPVADDLRKKGFIPGLWFELEVCTEGTKAFDLADHKLRRDGRILKVGSRHFWDFTDPWTFDYLGEKVIRRLKDDGFGYVKIDYNETIGLGCDDDDSLGEGLRKHLVGVQDFFRLLRKEVPDLIIEICSSGGHRLEPSMLALASQASFSDTHESPDLPIIAANLHRLMLPRQSQIWAVLHPTDTLQRIHYSLAACFLGRACLSGEISSLGGAQFELVRQDLEFYERIKHLIRDGNSTIVRDLNTSYRHPRGWQAVVRTLHPTATECLVVIHAFGLGESNHFRVQLPPSSGWEIREIRSIGISCDLLDGTVLQCDLLSPFSASVIHLVRSREHPLIEPGEVILSSMPYRNGSAPFVPGNG